ncbi:bifunctional (p)ppGpp synthetase/guanosine-3',5'-bis(diphosphate) 3'-pyrophosphohydrolase [Collinsella sp. AGMB00827]|uniref:Bifunctional (P)ppGpp synthetase/guanosine-3',5'-bis(Diphosphate) 3'-pyrophosphohydrolase n=1 Tax=Collinsella ureilytica TaxID=2869515 RepID=A0ABS7MM42_9ACTN|nr:bifunctional (p)ppGpp synthetase/guanosine-3',5'-bis(diphosphate) 3'-pyrophosphohydrolase [Collinsella urealyticum]MBY4798128.1 bifunctional (p)ppGpp synthetase/guanosine-3',5'-bis(diphosphate) 3'-pyrophosphohydrolase [Collinsella urealyticum]
MPTERMVHYTHAEDLPAEISAERWSRLKGICASYMGAEDAAKAELAYCFAAEKHTDQRRRSGEPYINHPVEVAIILAELKMDCDVVCAALLHDTVEDTETPLSDVGELFGATVTELVDGVTKLTNIEIDSMDAKQALNLRKMFLAMSRDIRVVIVKLADRLHNMRTLGALAEDRRLFKARETMDVYAPLADRLGISSMKWELEDLSFFYLEPLAYQRIARMVSESRSARERYLKEAIEVLQTELTNSGLTGFQIYGRSKHYWSIYQKMRRKGKEFSEIYDLVALRVITETVGDCYSALGAVHSLWHPMPGRFKDYIAMPKFNNYQSLHTTVIGPTARPLEIQIRTYSMHEQAEYGIAAHWLYKRAGSSSAKSGDAQRLDDQINLLKRSLDWAASDDIDDPKEFMHSLKIDLFDQEIFVFTPKGEVLSLRAGSTPLDFAYAIHTEVGNHCVGAMVNGAVAPLSHELAMGDRVEILTNKAAKPSRDWLGIVRTPSARSKIRRYFAAAAKDDDALSGRDALARDLRRRGYGISTQRTAKALAAIAEQLNYRHTEDLFAALGAGNVAVRSIGNKVEAILDPKPEEPQTEETAAEVIAEARRQARGSNRKPRGKRRPGSAGVVVKGGDADLLVRLAHCCNPVAGDDIVGFITRGRGVSVHRATCPNVKGLQEQPGRMIEVAWDGGADALFQVGIVIEGIDRIGMLKDVTVAIGDAGGNIISAATSTNREGIATLRFLVEISDASGLDPLLAAISRVDSVFDARRSMPGE